jgi:hypothetical protein
MHMRNNLGDEVGKKRVIPPKDRARNFDFELLYQGLGYIGERMSEMRVGASRENPTPEDNTSKF